MKNRKHFQQTALALCTAILLSGCASVQKKSDTRIYLLGEAHGSPAIMKFEEEQWENCYANGMRHLFIEFDYWTAKLLNVWMHEESDEILLVIYDSTEGNQIHIPEFLEFYRNIKANCPETVFHGIDIWGGPEIEDLPVWIEAGMITEEESKILKADAECRNKFLKYETEYYSPWAIREPQMTLNFIREFDALPADEKIMGIFGNAHVCYEREPNGHCESMRVQLEKHYGVKIECTDITYLCEEQNW